MSTRSPFQPLSVLIVVSLLVLVSACSLAKGETGLAIAEPTPSPLLEQPKVVYFTLSAQVDSLLGESIPPEVVVVKTSEELVATLERLPEARMLFLEPASIDMTDSALLQDYYNKGIMIVAVNTPIRELGSKLGVYTEMADLDMDTTPSGFTVFSAHQLVRDSEQGASRAWMLSDYFPSFADALSALAASPG